MAKYYDSGHGPTIREETTGRNERCYRQTGAMPLLLPGRTQGQHTQGPAVREEGRTIRRGEAGMTDGERLDRYQILKSMGFTFYNDYLDSDLWGEIRKEVFAVQGQACIRCGRKATQVHHSDYSEATLRGDDLSKLMPACSRCHKLAHRGHPGSSSTVTEATAFLRVPWRAKCGPKPGTPISEATRAARAATSGERARIRCIAGQMRMFRYIINPDSWRRHLVAMVRIHGPGYQGM